MKEEVVMIPRIPAIPIGAISLYVKEKMLSEAKSDEPRSQLRKKFKREFKGLDPKKKEKYINEHKKLAEERQKKMKEYKKEIGEKVMSPIIYGVPEIKKAASTGGMCNENPYFEPNSTQCEAIGKYISCAIFELAMSVPEGRKEEKIAPENIMSYIEKNSEYDPIVNHPYYKLIKEAYFEKKKQFEEAKVKREELKKKKEEENKNNQEEEESKKNKKKGKKQGC